MLQREQGHSLDSLVGQIKVDQHRKAIMIVCDGRVRGPDMEKTSVDYLLDDILTKLRGNTSRRHTQLGTVLKWTS
jgi:chitin synthase